MSSVRKDQYKALKGPDEFQVKVGAAIDWAVRNVRVLGYIVVPCAAVIIALLGYRYLQSNRKDARLVELGRAQSLYNSEIRKMSDLQKPILKQIEDLEAKAKPKTGSENGAALTPEQEKEIAALKKRAEDIKADHGPSLAEFTAFFKKYDSFPEGWQAAMTAAHILVEDHKLSDAIPLLDAVVNKAKTEPLYPTLAQLELAGLAEEKGEFDRELTILDNLEKTIDSNLKAQVLLMRGRALMLKGDQAGAKSTLGSLVDGYASSSEAQKARSLLSLINS